MGFRVCCALVPRLVDAHDCTAMFAIPPHFAVETMVLLCSHFPPRSVADKGELEARSIGMRPIATK